MQRMSGTDASLIVAFLLVLLSLVACEPAGTEQARHSGPSAAFMVYWVASGLLTFLGFCYFLWRRGGGLDTPDVFFALVIFSLFGFVALSFVVLLVLVERLTSFLNEVLFPWVSSMEEDIRGTLSWPKRDWTDHYRRGGYM